MTLTQTAILTRRVILFSVISLVVGIIGLIGYNIWHAYYLASLPPVEEKPDIKFGILPPPDFPPSSVSTSNFSYSLDTVTGGLPKVGVNTGFEKIIKVYFVTQTFATLLAPEKSSALAEKFNISSSPEILSDTRYRYKDQNKTLLVDLDSGNFSYNKEATPSANANSDQENNLVSDFKQVLSNLGLLKEELGNGRVKVIFLKEAQAVQVSLWPAPVDKRLIFTADFNKALVNTTVSGSASNLENYLSLNFTYYPIDTSTYATYPLKTPEQAFDDLKTGKGVVVVEPDKPQVSITSVSLGYYLPENYSPYLQPIFVFEGPNFVSYVSAINEQFQNQAR
ncbi:hypothetical protein HYU45_01920 [Candidatus Daviesbacteria bacterium]|nr:hypothetical protein [Candidatus Daviesbacteria bacterium]